MNRFSSTTDSVAMVPADRAAVWAALTDPDVLPQLTPLLHRIDADGDHWRWQMARIGVLGASITPVFTEKMVFHEPERIEYSHAPPEGATERTSAEGWYELVEVPEGTRLAISLTVSVDLPLARAARPAVERVMSGVMARMGDRFAANLMEHLGVSPE